MRSQGAGGQNVNKVATAVHCRFDIKASSLPADVQQRLLAYNDHRLTQDGTVVIKSQSQRTQKANREEALKRLSVLLQKALQPPKKRKLTQPKKSAKAKRLLQKRQHADKKRLRKNVRIED